MISERLAVIDDRGQIDVWVVDDDDQSRLVTTAALQEESIIRDAVGFPSAEEALEVLRYTQSPPDIIFLDIVLPGMNGLDAIRHFKQASSVPSVAVITGFNSEENLLKALRQDALAYLVKPLTIEKLNAAVRDIQDNLVHIDKEAVRILTESVEARMKSGREYGLTVKEREILHLIRAGLSDESIAERLIMSPGTLRKHLEHIHQKLGVHDRAGVILKIFKENLI